MGGTFAAYRVAKTLPPLAGPQGETWGSVLGAAQDNELALLRVAALSRFPRYCPDDGLDPLGLAFLLPRYPNEASSSYRARLQGAFDAYAEGGSGQAIVDQLVAYGIVDADFITEENNSYPGSPSGWYSRFDVSIGPDFGTVAVSRAVCSPLLANTTASFVAPAVGATVSTSTDSSLTTGKVVFIGGAGYYQVQTGGTSPVLVNLGGAFAAETALGLLHGTLGFAANAPAGHTIASAQQVVLAYTAPAVNDGTGGSALICGPPPDNLGPPIGFQIANASDRVAIKAIILRWKTVTSYAGRIVLEWDTLSHGASWPYATAFVYIGRMIGLSFICGVTPCGGYDRS